MYRRPDGLYEKVITVGGKRVYFRGKTEKEVERKMLEYNERRETGEPFRAIVKAVSKLSMYASTTAIMYAKSH